LKDHDAKAREKNSRPRDDATDSPPAKRHKHSWQVCCGQNFPTLRQLLNHWEAYPPSQPRKCAYDGCAFSGNNLSVHERLRHFKCTCGYTGTKRHASRIGCILTLLNIRKHFLKEPTRHSPDTQLNGIRHSSGKSPDAQLKEIRRSFDEATELVQQRFVSACTDYQKTIRNLSECRNKVLQQLPPDERKRLKNDEQFKITYDKRFGSIRDGTWIGFESLEAATGGL